MDVHTPNDLGAVAQALLKRKPKLIALTGPLGVGKTTLTQVLAKTLGVPGQVTSPTYVLQQVYRAQHPGYTTLVHVDAYRLASEAELPALDLTYWLQQPKTLVVIEWADRIQTFLEPFAPLWVTLTQHGERRTVTVR